MASYTKEKNKTYTLRYRVKDSGGKWHNKSVRGFERQKDAKTYYERTVVPTLQCAPKASKMTVKEVYEEFVRYKRGHLKDPSILLIMENIERFVLPYFANKNIFSIKPADLIAWQTKIDEMTYVSGKKNPVIKKYSYIYKTKIRNNFYALFEYLKIYGAESNPFSCIKGFANKEIRNPSSFWTQEEFETFIKVVDSQLYKTFFSVLYLSGCRKGELIGLKWSDIDWECSFLSITKTYSRKILDKTEEKFKLTTPKNTSSNRKILMPQIAMNALKGYYSKRKEIEDFSDDWFVFGHTKPISENAIATSKDKYCKIAGVKRIRIHDFRHSHASLLVNSGQNILAVAHRLGHSDVEQTLNTYSHMFDRSQEALINGIEVKLD